MDAYAHLPWGSMQEFSTTDQDLVTPAFLSFQSVYSEGTEDTLNKQLCKTSICQILINTAGKKRCHKGRGMERPTSLIGKVSGLVNYLGKIKKGPGS